ncbi:hypothetical protein ACLOJK_000582 [Asimina triloba]
MSRIEAVGARSTEESKKTSRVERAIAQAITTRKEGVDDEVKVATKSEGRSAKDRNDRFFMPKAYQGRTSVESLEVELVAARAVRDLTLMEAAEVKQAVVGVDALTKQSTD